MPVVRPILFSGPMVRALVDGRKTQTRRIVKGQAANWLADRFSPEFTALPGNRLCPYGEVGDLLYVRETWRTESRRDDQKPSEIPTSALVSFDADYTCEPNDGCRGKTRVSIHMPRWASRLTLEITGVRIERLNDISEADALAEGIMFVEPTMDDDAEYQFEEGGDIFSSAVEAYRYLWAKINGPDSWDANPWVWAVSFVVHKSNVDAIPVTQPPAEPA